MAMTSVLAEAVRELAVALDVPFDLKAEDSGVPVGEVFVQRPDQSSPTRMKATVVCWFVLLDGHEFKDYLAAMMYLRVLGVRDET